jgi:hypothetical protein
MGSYNFKLDSSKKVLNVKVEGRFDEQDGMKFIGDYNNEVKKFKPSDYNIDLDCTELAVTSQDVLPLLENCYNLYQQTGFKKIIFTIKNNITLKMQLNRIATKTGLNNYEIIQQD